MSATGPRGAQAGVPEGEAVGSLARTSWIRIDLDALVGNLAAVRRAAGAGVAVHPVVKADAYGHGALPVSRALADAGADGLCVATFEEAVELRDAGLGLPLLVLFPVPPHLAPEAARRRIALAVGDDLLLRRTLRALSDAGRAGGEDVPRPPLALHLEIETGLGRGGVLPAGAREAAAAIAAAPGVELAGIWSHLATPEDPAVAGRQAERLEEAVALVAGDVSPLPARHLAASGGVMAATVPRHQAVRVGLAMYGLLPGGFPVDRKRLPAAEGLRPVMSIHARPIRVADLPAGAGVGYDATWVAPRPSRVATLPVGYGDGWTRAYSNRTAALVRGRRVPLVGNVAMDAVMVDVTAVPGPPVTVDDEVVLLGRQGEEEISAVELAAARGSHPWEVVTAMRRRMAHVYVRGGRAVEVRTLLGS